MSIDYQTNILSRCRNNKFINFNKLYAISVWKPDWQQSAKIIQCSRVNQALCDHAEHGKAHGYGTITSDGFWTMGSIRLNLNLSNSFPSGKFSLLEDFCQSTPVISQIGNGYRPPTTFQYLWMSATGGVYHENDAWGISNSEYLQAVNIGGKWGLTAHWGNKNRVSSNTNWYEDFSICTTWPDNYGWWFIVMNYNGIPQYAFEIINGCVLPFVYLKRIGWDAPRRVYFTPEKDIAIFFRNADVHSAEHIVLTNNVGLIINNDLDTEKVAWGCFPGGTSSINASDFSCLRGKKITLLVADMNDTEDMAFAIKLATRLRAELYNFQLGHIAGERINGNMVQNPKLEEFELEELRKMANKNNIVVPPELYDDFLGDLSSEIANYKQEAVVEHVLYKGDVVELKIDENVPAFIAESHLAKSLSYGNGIANIPHATAIFIQAESTSLVAQYLQNSNVKTMSYKFMEESNQEKAIQKFKYVLGVCKVVLFNDIDSVDEKLFFELLKYCKANKIATIVAERETTIKKIKSLISSTIAVSSLGNAIVFASSKLDCNYKVELDNECNISKFALLNADEREEISPSKGIASPQFDINKPINSYVIL